MNKRIWSVLCLVLLFCALSKSVIWAKETKEETEEPPVTILFTHDLHSRVESYKKGSKVIGGFARLKTKLEEEKQRNKEALVLDGGDFSMGTLYQTLYETHAAELTLLARMGYDAVTLGNHEFDYGSEGLANMLHAACNTNEEGLVFPKLVSSNIDWTEKDKTENKKLQEELDHYGSTPYAMFEKAGIKIGVFGVMGEDADLNITTAGVDIGSTVEASKEMVTILKEQGAELVICLSHSGTKEQKSQSEDEQLAKEVPEIDVIISAHTHTTLKEPIVSNHTTIVSAGNDGETLGVLDLIPDQNGRWKIGEYRLEKIKSSIQPDAAIEQESKNYQELIDDLYLKRFGYEAKQVLAENSVKFKSEEEPMGNLISDAYIYAIKEAEGASYEPVCATVVPEGSIRDTLQKGKINVSQAFHISSLGMGADGIPGYPLVAFYLKGEDLKTVAEMDASFSAIMPEAQLYPSGMKWVYNPNRMFLNRVTEAYLVDTKTVQGENAYEAALQEIEEEKLYRVAAGFYSMQMLGAVEGLSKGLLHVTPRDKAGVPIQKYEDYIVYGQNQEELKEWCALAAYLESFEKNEEGIPQVAEKYADAEGRKIKENSSNIIEIVKHPNKFTIAAGIFILVILLLIILAVRIMIKKYEKRKRR